MDKDTENYARKLVHGCRSSEHGIPIFKEFFTMQELNMALSNLDPSKSPGPDNIHGQMISDLEGLPRVHFKPEMGAHTSKNQDPPEYLRQLALEIINKIPATAMQIYTDGSKDEQNSWGSGIFIKAPNCSHNIKIRN
ncbi:hypothetical protein TNCV_4605031 [Trichonephila clavipes]|nr:hypothetical protein TNCV_4605031 [Trichonephila clavipes]